MHRHAIRWITSLAVLGTLGAGSPAWAQHFGHRGFGFGFAYYGGYGYYPFYGYYPSYGYASYDASGSVRLQVKPDQARVFVEGYYAGIADDFDGLFHRLHLSPGRHEITLRLEGYKTHRVQVYVAAGHTLKIRHEMVRGTGEDEPEGRAAAGARPDGDREEQREAPPREEREVRGGEVRMRVHPEDASVYVDGEFRGSGLDVRSFPLPAGRHRIEVVRPGFRAFDREVEVDPGRTLRLDVELERR